MARTKTVVGNNFTEVKLDGTRAKCKNCGDHIVANADRMKKHSDNCNKSEPPPAKVMKQSTILDAVTSKEKNHQIQLSMGKYFIAFNTTFRQVETKAFKDMVTSFKPGIQFANRKKLAGPILD